MTTPAIAARDVSKLYRRHQGRHQFKTLKSALLTGSLITDLAPADIDYVIDVLKQYKDSH